MVFRIKVSGVRGVALAHIGLSGLLFLASVWHWVYWDLELFRDPRTGLYPLSYKNFGIHLLLSGFYVSVWCIPRNRCMGTRYLGFRCLWNYR